MARVERRSMTALAMVLAGCGGGGCSGGDAIVVAPTSSTPSPTPSPASTPSPAPSSTPSPVTYETATDFTRDRDVDAVAATTAVITPMPGAASGTATVALEPSTDGIGFSYVAATGLYRARHRGDTFEVLPEKRSDGDEFHAADATASLRYFVRAPFTAGAVYTGLAIWAEQLAEQRLRVRRLIFGARTVAGDLPTTGTTGYGGRANVTERGNATYELGAISGGIISADSGVTIDWVTRQVTGDIRVRPPSGTGSTYQSPTVYTLSGTVAADGRVTGTITSSEVAGTFAGAVFGPRAAEIGFVLVASGARGGEPLNFTGHVIATSYPG